MLTTGSRDFSLYFHIPFCKKKCPYCHFYVVRNRVDQQDILLDALQIEWEKKRPLLEGKKLLSIYFGGGTPTLLPPHRIGEILQRIQASGFSLDDVEITIEANPEEGEVSHFAALRSAGINRLSIGVQSLHDASLQQLGRAHGAKRAIDAILAAEKALFRNISIDLMYDLPEQTEESFYATLQQIHHLPIHHLSLYNLTIEPDTPFYRKRNQLILPDSESSLRLLQLALEQLSQAGFIRYEISAFAKDNHQSRHNRGYWTGRPFLGLGPSAFSFWEGQRMCNVPNLLQYATLLKEGKAPTHFIEQLAPPRDAQELFTIGLRLLEGVDLQTFPTLSTETMSACHKWLQADCLEQIGSILRLTKKGTFFYDAIATDLI